jgi:hypothetical protein
VWDGALENASIVSISTILTVVSILSVLSIVSWWSCRSGWALLAVATGRRWFRIDNAIATGWLGIVRILTLLAGVAILLVEDAHLRPHVARSGLAELRLGDQMALEAGHVAVKHWQCDD